MLLEEAFLSINNEEKKKKKTWEILRQTKKCVCKKQQEVNKIYLILVHDSDAATKSTCSPASAWHINDA